MKYSGAGNFGECSRSQTVQVTSKGGETEGDGKQPDKGRPSTGEIAEIAQVQKKQGPEQCNGM